eukprot:58712-Prymnesium_polylepis.2
MHDASVTRQSTKETRTPVIMSWRRHAERHNGVSTGASAALLAESGAVPDPWPTQEASTVDAVAVEKLADSDGRACQHEGDATVGDDLSEVLPPPWSSGARESR